MRKISIVGAGQFGLHLGIALQRAGYDVTIMSNRTGEQLRNGRVLSSQILFRPVLEMEAALGLNPWHDQGFAATGNSLTVANGKGGKILSIGQPVEGGMGQSVDQRLKMPLWMDLFEQAGGKLVIADAGLPELQQLADQSDLVIVAAGKGEIARLFERDPQLSVHDKPQRHVAMFYVNGMKPDHLGGSTLRFVQVPSIGEYVTFPGITHSGGCDILLFESVIGGPMHNLMKDADTGEKVLAGAQQILRTYIPWEAERCVDMQLTDDQAWLAGSFAPTIRRAFARLPSGQAIMGGGDVVVINDPIIGQGANNASKHADVVFKAIVAHGDRPFDEAFMQRTFDAHWEKAQWVCRFTNMMLNPPAHTVPVIMAMLSNKPLLNAFQEGFADASTLSDWLFDEASAMRKIASFHPAAALAA